MKKGFLALLGLTFFLSNCQTTHTVYTVKGSEMDTAKNIIFIIGDGMGMGQISAGTYNNGNFSYLENFPITGIHKPTCYDSLITDSAAGATAFACGQKTYYHAIAVDKDTLPMETILEEAEKKGLSTGLVATSTIVHATPASFIAHNSYRRNYEEIAEDFLKTEIDYFVGGGKKFFDRRAKDDRNLLEELEAKNYNVGNYLEDFNDFRKSINIDQNVAYLTSDNDPLPYNQGRDYLIDAAITGLDFLKEKSKEKGFFIMIESSQIDWGGHANNADYILTEFAEFNMLLKEVLQWAKNDGETLVIVTGDHETGGFTVQTGSTMDELKTAFTSKKHTGDFIPVFAYGPTSGQFSGIYENTMIYNYMRRAFGWDK